MVHIYFVVYAILAIIASIAQFAVASLRRRSPSRLHAYLALFHATLLVAVLSDYAFFYFSPNVLSINPLATDIGMDIYRRSIPFFMFLVIGTCSYPFFFYFLFSIFAVLTKRNDRATKRICLDAAIVLALWFLLSNCSIPLAFATDGRAKGIVCFVNNDLMLILQIAAVAALCLYWLRNRPADAQDAPLGDSLALVMAIMVAVSGIRYLGERALSGRAWARPMREALLLATNRTFLLCLLVDSSIALYVRKRPIGFRARGPDSEEPARYSIPDGFDERHRLTPREREIARLIAAGLANKEISDRLGISYNTVKNHIASLFAKLGIESRFELVAKIIEFRDSPRAENAERIGNRN